MKQIKVVDSHTGGEPTRVVIEGGPDLGAGSVADQLSVFRKCHDDFRRAVVNEPRGSDVLVGALLVTPSDSSCAFGVIFFDNVQCIGMCGHGTIGLVATLQYLGRMDYGEYRIETSVGVVTVELHVDGTVSVTNVAAHRKVKAAAIEITGYGMIVGDVAWGGNWFFLVEQHSHDLLLENVEELTQFAWKIRQSVNAQGFPEVDHIVLLQQVDSNKSLSKNFVLCPGKAYDRSPCGTGTSARLSCLAADGRLAENQSMIQESIVGSKFVGRFRWLDRNAGTILPTITGQAFVTGHAILILDERDPFCYGIR
ncbi:MAG: proline racemase family protein [Pirellulaceae bacterium]|nr:proline racemase family protein [Pirellulaceae bacterium]